MRDLAAASTAAELRIYHVSEQLARRLEEGLDQARDITPELLISNEFQLIAERLESHLIRFRHFQEDHTRILQQRHLKTFLQDLKNNIIIIRSLIIQPQPVE